GVLFFWPSNETIANAEQLNFTTLTSNGYSEDSQASVYVDYALNLSGLSLNWTYDAQVWLNYSTIVGGTRQPFSQQSSALQFWYEGDSSGDGLTNTEKLLGWSVTYQGLSSWT